MIIINLIGGLGNQMFQYAAARALTLEKKQKLSLNIQAFDNYRLHKYGLFNFNVNQNLYPRPTIINRIITKLFKNKINYIEQEFNYNASIHNIKGNPIHLEGYFQSEKYFLKYEKEIRADFKISAPFKQKTLDAIAVIKSVDSVSIHIRRGDYLLHEFHNTDKQEFYSEAMHIIENKIINPVYFVFSDDMNWVKNNFKTNCVTHFIDFNDADTNYEDLKLMSSCQHNIIANSSFSWWGAWLNPNPNKIVIAPQKWFNEKSINYSDVVPERWIKL